MLNKKMVGPWALVLSAGLGLGWWACSGDTEVVRVVKNNETGDGGSPGVTGGSNGGDKTGGMSGSQTGGSGNTPATGGAGNTPAETGGKDAGTGGAGNSSTGGAATGGKGGAGAGTTGGMMATGGSGAGPATGGMSGESGPVNVLIWNNAVAYGHQSRATAIPLLKARESTDNIKFDTTYAHTGNVGEGPSDTTADASVFTDTGLAKYDVIFFLNTTGATLKTSDGMENAHRTAVENFIKKGHGFVGTHSATDTYQANQTNWTWYVNFIGANFDKHSGYPTSGTARYNNGVTAANNPLIMAANTPNPWNRSEEWYTFTRDPLSTPLDPAGMKILLTCNDGQFGDRATSWTHELTMDPSATQTGRLWYSAFGHDVSAFKEKAFLDLIVAGIKWAAHRI